MRQWLSFDVEGTSCVATIDAPSGDNHHPNGLLIVSGGNEIRSGAHRGMARLAAEMAKNGHPVFRFDRRGIGDSDGENQAYECSAPDLTTAVAAFSAAFPNLKRITAYGNCDAATALALFHKDTGIDALVLSNPWTIETMADADNTNTLPPPAAIRARYLQRLKNPAEWKRLLTGGVNLRKLAQGLSAARGSVAEANTNDLASRIAAALHAATVPITSLRGQQDRTAQLYEDHRRTPSFAPLHQHIPIHSLRDGNHGFTDTTSTNWFYQQIRVALNQE